MYNETLLDDLGYILGEFRKKDWYDRYEALSVGERYAWLCKRRQMEEQGILKMRKDESWVLTEYEKHGNRKWLETEDVNVYAAEGAKIRSPLFVGERKQLCLKMVEIYGITEQEALNITNGYGGRDYVRMYYRIRNLLILRKIEKDKDKSRKGKHSDD